MHESGPVTAVRTTRAIPRGLPKPSEPLSLVPTRAVPGPSEGAGLPTRPLARIGEWAVLVALGAGPVLVIGLIGLSKT